MTAMTLLSFMPTQMKAESKPATTMVVANPNSPEAQQANALIARLYEIKAMDHKNLKAADKKALRKEVRSIKSHLKALSGGVYLSATAIVIILLIILLIA